MKKNIMLFLIVFIGFIITINNLAYGATEYKSNKFKEDFNKENSDVNYDIIINTVQKYIDTAYYEQEIIDLNLIPLENINGERFAFLVPLMENKNHYNGFVVIGALDGRYEVLMSSIDSDDLTEKLIRSANGHEIIYNFPNDFLIKKNNNSIYLINNDLSETLVNDSISKYDSKTKEYLLEDKKIEIIPRASYTEASLLNWTTFIQVANTYYGGNQNWLTSAGVSQFYADRSCGVTAAANALCYIAKSNSTKSNLYNKSSTSYVNFRTHMKEVYDYLKPAIWGIPSINTMKTRVESFSQSRDVSLKGVISSSSWTITNVANYIKTGLKANSPVLMLTWNSSSEPDLKNHWVTITRLFRVSETNVRYVTVSNWGARYDYNFDAWFNAGSLYQGVLYFQ